MVMDTLLWLLKDETVFVRLSSEELGITLQVMPSWLRWNQLIIDARSSRLVMSIKDFKPGSKPLLQKVKCYVSKLTWQNPLQE